MREIKNFSKRLSYSLFLLPISLQWCFDRSHTCRGLAIFIMLRSMLRRNHLPSCVPHYATQVQISRHSAAKRLLLNIVEYVLASFWLGYFSGQKLTKSGTNHTGDSSVSSMSLNSSGSKPPGYSLWLLDKWVSSPVSPVMPGHFKTIFDWARWFSKIFEVYRPYFESLHSFFTYDKRSA